MFAQRTALRPSDAVLRGIIVALTLATAYIHSTLGGLLFTLNALRPLPFEATSLFAFFAGWLTSELPIHHIVWQAVRCHRTQLPAYQALEQVSDEQHRILWNSQTYYRVYSLVNGGRGVEDDLFAGLR